MRKDRPFGCPDWYDMCPVCKQDFRKCDHSWEQADKAYLRAEQRKVLRGRGRGNDIARVVNVDGVNLYLWHDGKVTWSNE